MSKRDHSRAFGATIRKKRGERTVRDVACEVGISPATVSRIERGGVPSLKTWMALMRWMGKDPLEPFRKVWRGRDGDTAK